MAGSDGTSPSGWHYRHWHLGIAALVLLFWVVAVTAGLLVNAVFVASLAAAGGAMLHRLYGAIRGQLVWPLTARWRGSPLPWQVLNRTVLWILVAASMIPALPRERLGDDYLEVLSVAAASWTLILVLAWIAPAKVSVVRNVLVALASLVLGLWLVRSHRPPAKPVVLASPFASGEWLVVQGGRSPFTNYHHGARSQRHALDFIHADTPAPTRGAPLADSPSFGAPLLAPAEGRVACVIDGHPDLPIGRADPDNPAGNCISIQIAPGRFLILAHLQHGSILVKPGDPVGRGDPIARVGNSGNTSEPHLHLQVQNMPEMARARGVRTYPIVFEGLVRYRGQKTAHLEAKADLRRGDRIGGVISPARLAQRGSLPGFHLMLQPMLGF